jgi:NAD(P)-dependent dehydrogenase (short-subunit alcohol dehydrogenase family)
MSRFSEKVMVITGAGSGLGRECALQWAAEGASIVVSDVVEARALAVTEEIESKGGRALGIKADVAVESEVEQTVRAAVETFGQLDVMFANAGRSMTPRSEGGGSLALEDVTQAQWDDVTNVNFRGVFFSGKYACHAMKKQGFGNIVVTVSAAATNSYPGIAVYGAGKAGLLGLIRGMATDWGKYGIRVNGLAPTHGMSVNFGLPLSAPVEGLSYEEFGIRNSGHAWNPKRSFPGPLKVQRPPSLRDNAAVATFLASDDSQYMSGITIPSCDGGSIAISSMHFPDDWSLEEQVSTVANESGTD